MKVIIDLQFLHNFLQEIISDVTSSFSSFNMDSRIGSTLMSVSKTYETEKELVIELDLPGIDPDTLEVSIKEKLLVVKGSRDGVNFMKNIQLPDNVDVENVKATYRNGVLKIVIAKLKEEGAQEKVIKVEKL